MTRGFDRISPERLVQLVMVGFAAVAAILCVRRSMGIGFAFIIAAALSPLWVMLLYLLCYRLLHGPSRKPGSCSACGYDLAGLGVDAPCPECGGGGKGAGTT